MRRVPARSTLRTFPPPTSSADGLGTRSSISHSCCLPMLLPRQCVEGVPSPAAVTSRAKFAFGSRLPDAGQSLLQGPKRSGSARFNAPTRMRYGHDAHAPVNPRKRRRSVSRDEEMSSDKPSHRALTVKTALSLQGSHLPAPTKVSALLSGAHLHTISPSNPALQHKKRRSAEERELAADLAATEPAFWIKRREGVEAALKDLDAVEESFMTISK